MTLRNVVAYGLAGGLAVGIGLVACGRTQVGINTLSAEDAKNMPGLYKVIGGTAPGAGQGTAFLAMMPSDPGKFIAHALTPELVTTVPFKQYSLGGGTDTRFTISHT